MHGQEMIRVFVGLDPRETVAYHVFCQSLIEKSSQPLSITPLYLPNLTGYTEKHTDGSNQFIYSRFLVPHLCNYTGWAIFFDGDMVCLDDVKKLWDMRDESKAVMVVKHDYQTKASVKYLGAKNENYPRKNWSSVILWNCSHPWNLCMTPELVASETGAFLHRFEWLKDEYIGEIPSRWNYLAEEYKTIEDVSLIHYTLGTPCFEQYKACEYSDRWHDVLAKIGCQDVPNGNNDL